MANRIDGTTPLPNSNIQESKENVAVLPHSIFEKAVQPTANTRALGGVTPLTNMNFEESLQKA
ncbi:MAG TPA: hypothetical protein VLE96_03080, partial [Chlamydiales bacterium]|nr:hypothetical protein [Chlamydiales bacterium]